MFLMNILGFCRTKLLQKVHHRTWQLQDALRGQSGFFDEMHNAVFETNIDLITMMLEHLEKEGHEFL